MAPTSSSPSADVAKKRTREILMCFLCISQSVNSTVVKYFSTDIIRPHDHSLVVHIYCVQYNYINEEGLGVQKVGELVECLGHRGPSSLRDVELPCDHHIIGPVFGRQEEHTFCVGLVVEEGYPPLAQVVGVVLHLDHQVCETETKRWNQVPF